MGFAVGGVGVGVGGVPSSKKRGVARTAKKKTVDSFGVSGKGGGGLGRRKGGDLMVWIAPASSPKLFFLWV